MAFVHLHVHSQYSVLDGTMDPKSVAARAAALGMPAIALTDTGNLYGAVAFYKACKDKGVHALIGAELHVQPEGIEFEDHRAENGGYQVIALVEDEDGYKSLCALITAGIFDGMRYKPRVDLKALAARHKGLIFLTGGLRGAFGRAAIAGDADGARTRVRELMDAVGAGQLYLELQDVGLQGQEAVNAVARTLSRELDVPTVVTNAVHYDRPEDAPVLDVLHAISAGAPLSDTTRARSPTDQAYLKTEAEIREIFPDDPEAVDRTTEVAARCHYKYRLGEYLFPSTTPPDFVEGKDAVQPDTDANWQYFYAAFPPPRSYEMPDPTVLIPPRPDGAGNLQGYFGWYARSGLKIRFRDIPDERHDVYWARLERELSMIGQMGFPAYLLIVAEFINWSKDHGIPVGPGRGSAAGSLVAWAMGITDIDPIRFDLLFERFLNPERVSMPDIDVDFCQDRREESIEHVRAKYGAPLVSQIITFGTLKAKAAVRDVARVLELQFGEADRIAKLVPEALNTTLKSALADTEMLRRLHEGDPKVRRVVETAIRVEGMVRQTGVHAAGVVIADRPLVDVAPLYRDGPEGGPVVQTDMKSAEAIGLIKFDFLGLKTLDQIRDALVMIKENYGSAPDMARIPEDDPETFTLLQAGDALGVFQLESSGMRDLLTRLRPSVLDDIVALVALYRPGPLESGMVDDFVERKHGRQKVTFFVPALEPILRNTYGVIVYQEQVMQIAQVLAGYSLGEADLLRRAMGKKDAKEMDRQKSRFVDGAVANEIDGQMASEIFDLLAKFASYGFNKSHSAAYGVVCYQTAYLKAHHRPEYMAALLSIEAGDTDKLLVYISDCRRAGVELLPVCVNSSIESFSVPKALSQQGKAAIRYGLGAVKGVGSGSIRAIVDERQRGGLFRDVLDFFERIDPKALNRRVLEQLVKAGAFDTLGVGRSKVLAALDELSSEGGRRRAEKLLGQGVLFGGGQTEKASRTFRFPAVADWSILERMEMEREALGLYLTGHPLEAYAPDVKRLGALNTSQLSEMESDSDVRVVGVAADVRVVKTKRGDKMAFVQLQDDRGTVECVFFPDPWLRSQGALKPGEVVLVSAKVEIGEEGPKLKGNAAEPIAEVRTRTVRKVFLDLRAEDLTDPRLEALKAVFERERGNCTAHIHVAAQGRFTATFDVPGVTVAPSRALEDAVHALFGRSDVVTFGV